MRFSLCLLSAVVVGSALDLAAQPRWPASAWASADPAELGLDGGVLAAFDAELASGKFGQVDSFLVIRHGQVAFARDYPRDYARLYAAEARQAGPLNSGDPTGPYNYFNPWWHPYYQGGDLHTLQSVTKSVTSAIIGTAIGRGDFPAIDTPVLSFFDAAKVANVDERKRRMTIRHLLTMTAGFDWNEDMPYADPRNHCIQMEAVHDWVQFALDRPMAVEPGTKFQYNSGATQILAHLFRVATRRDIEEYAVEHFFRPLGITRHFWKRSPTGLIDTEGGLYLTARDLARVAYLFLRNGEWNGTVVVPADWVKASVAPSIAVSASGVKYGYKWWLHPYGQEGRLAFAGSGFGGQRPIVISEFDLVIVYTAWNILPGQPSLSAREAIDRVLAAVKDK